MPETFDAIVVGAGEAGAVVASRAVEAGLRVAMLYREPYGSTCVNTGCVPSKFLIHRANVTNTIRTSARFDVDGHGEPGVDLAAIVADKEELIDEHRDEAFGNAQRARNLTLIEGEARFVGPREVEVGERRLRSERIFVATGMRPEVPDIPGVDAVEALTNETVMNLSELPEHLVVLGGGYMGCELGQAYRRFGSRVTIIHGPELTCADEEPDVSRLLARGLRADGIELLLDHRAVRRRRRLLPRRCPAPCLTQPRERIWRHARRIAAPPPHVNDRTGRALRAKVASRWRRSAVMPRGATQPW